MLWTIEMRAKHHDARLKNGKPCDTPNCPECEYRKAHEDPAAICGNPDCFECKSRKAKKEAEVRFPEPKQETPEEAAQRKREAKKEFHRIVAQEQRAGPRDRRFADRDWLLRTGEEVLWNLFAEKRGGKILRNGEQLQPGFLVYEVWAVTRKQAARIAKFEVFAAGPAEPGIRSIHSGGTVLDQAPYLTERSK